MSNTYYSYSRVECFNRCPYLYKLRYIDGLKTFPSDDPANPLIIGSTLHKAIESGLDEAREYYYNQYPIIGDAHIHEFMKIEVLLPKILEVLPKGESEIKLEDSEFVGFIDYLTEDSILDFKYSNNVGHYLESGQLSIYKHFYEKTHPGHTIDNLYFVFVPKTMIRQKKTEDLYQFRQRLLATLDKMEVRVEKVEFNFLKVMEYLTSVESIKFAREYPKCPSRLCDWCEFQGYCEKGETTNIINIK